MKSIEGASQQESTSKGHLHRQLGDQLLQKEGACLVKAPLTLQPYDFIFLRLNFQQPCKVARPSEHRPTATWQPPAHLGVLRQRRRFVSQRQVAHLRHGATSAWHSRERKQAIYNFDG